MIRLTEFELALWTLQHLDMQELVDCGAIADRDYPTWDRFQADRVTWFLLNPAKAPAVWQAIWRRKSPQQASALPDNVIALSRHGRGKS